MPYRYAHMCRDDHIQIGHNDSGDDERCPLCRLMAALIEIRDHAESIAICRAIATQATRSNLE